MTAVSTATAPLSPKPPLPGRPPHRPTPLLPDLPPPWSCEAPLTPLSEAAAAYDAFQHKTDGTIKVLFQP